MKDEIIQEVWKAKDALAAQCGHNIKALVDYLRAQETAASIKSVDLHARQHDTHRASR
ncbi:MAG: hypothetical protein NTY53_25255 [Kiritimatiellaeota bacterium]|nr:hypothetical protein [Kiritimatiellota bacterium]